MGLIIIINLILQGSIMPFFEFLVYIPNPALVSVVIISIFKGKYYGAFFGLILGLLQDILYGDIIGIYGLAYFLIAYGIGMVHDYLNEENKIIHIVFTAIGTVLYNLIYSLVIYFLARNITFVGSMKRIFSIEILYNCVIAILIYNLFHGLFHKSSLKFGKKTGW